MLIALAQRSMGDEKRSVATAAGALEGLFAERERLNGG
jgi:hypothetical protein